MEIRDLGRTGIKISALGFGAGGFWGMKAFDERTAHSLIHASIDRGINFFDTGPNYSHANAEARLGRALKGHHDVLVGTKCGTHYRNGRHVKDYSAAALGLSLECSLRKLNRDYVDFLQLHGVPTLTDETIDFLFRAKESGKARFIGASGTVTELEHAMSCGLLDVAMTEYNVVRRRAEGFIASAAQVGVGIFAQSPLAQTLYSNRIFRVRSLADLWYLARAVKNSRDSFRQARKLRFVDHQTALQYVLANPNISSAVTGTVSIEHLAENCKASLGTLPPATKIKIEAVI